MTERDSAALRLDALSAAAARQALHRCCASSAWVEEMLRRRPFGDDETLFEAADEAWWALDPDDWLEAFAGHPRIGEREAAAFKTAGWSREEQSGVEAAAAGTRRELGEGNRAYEEKFGHVFLICATGKSAAEMLAALRRRMENDPQTELRVAAEEQRNITRLRLEKLGAESR